MKVRLTTMAFFLITMILSAVNLYAQATFWDKPTVTINDQHLRCEQADNNVLNCWTR